MYDKNGRETCMFILGNHIRKKREELKLTQADLASGAWLDADHMGKIERGEREVGSYILWKILHTLNADWNTISQEIEEALTKIEELESADKSKLKVMH